MAMMLHQAEEWAATRIDPKMPADALRAAVFVRGEGERMVATLRGVMFPEDDDG